MKIVFVSVVLNSHQVGVADRLFDITGGNFRFIETGHAQELDKKGGEDFSSRPYLIKANDKKEELYRLIEEADVMVYGAAPIEYLRYRVRTGKLTFLYSERWLKRGLKNLLSPRLFRQQLFYHLHCHGKPLYALCASAFAAGDFNMLFAFRNKCFKWGYFPPTPEINFNEIACKTKEHTEINILWVGRFISWKHPEMMIGLAKRLQSEGCKYRISMIGDGELRPLIEKEALKNNLNIKLEGALSNRKVQEIMRRHQIFCFTSDRQEGWGAVLNEAMSNGCCPIASSDAGSTLFLVKDGHNGYTFRQTDDEDFHNKVSSIMNNREQLMTLRKSAYDTIHEQWNAITAAGNLVRLSKDLLNNQTPSISEGPCSKAVE